MLKLFGNNMCKTWIVNMISRFYQPSFVSWPKRTF